MDLEFYFMWVSAAAFIIAVLAFYQSDMARRKVRRVESGDVETVNLRVEGEDAFGGHNTKWTGADIRLLLLNWNRPEWIVGKALGRSEGAVNNMKYRIKQEEVDLSHLNEEPELTGSLLND